MIKTKVYHWFLGDIYGDTIYDIDLQKFIEDITGAVIVKPPSVTGEDHWLVITTDKTNRFNQR